MVITGASSGIGLVTARMAAPHGARLVLAARSGEELRQLAHENEGRGGQAIAVEADVGHEEDVQRIADSALERFHGFDTWVNNAGVSLFGRLEEVSLADARRHFATNSWGTVYGYLVAVRHLKHRGGALINLGSVASDRAFPVQGIYSASKHAVKGFTDALRVELEAVRAPVCVTLIKPTFIATPLPQHAGNYIGVEPTLPPPVYAPETVARAILGSAEHPAREVAVGGASKAMSMAAAAAPGLMDRYLEATSFRQRRTDRSARQGPQGILHRASHDLSERGVHDWHVFETSTYTAARLHPLLTGAADVGAGVAVGGIWAALKGSRHGNV
jgi:short-subunit dehydrogenase